MIAQAARAALERLSEDRERLVRASAAAALGDVTRSYFERGLVLAGSADLAGADVEFRKAAESTAVDISAFASFNRGVLAALAGDMLRAETHYPGCIGICTASRRPPGRTEPRMHL